MLRRRVTELHTTPHLLRSDDVVKHAYNLTLGAVDNPATSRTAPHPEARCMRGKPREIGGQ